MEDPEHHDIVNVDVDLDVDLQVLEDDTSDCEDDSNSNCIILK